MRCARTGDISSSPSCSQKRDGTSSEQVNSGRSTWPWSQDVLAKQTEGMTEQENNFVLHDNVAELYQLSI